MMIRSRSNIILSLQRLESQEYASDPCGRRARRRHGLIETPGFPPCASPHRRRCGRGASRPSVRPAVQLTTPTPKGWFVICAPSEACYDALQMSGKEREFAVRLLTQVRGCGITAERMRLLRPCSDNDLIAETAPPGKIIIEADIRREFSGRYCKDRPPRK